MGNEAGTSLLVEEAVVENPGCGERQADGEQICLFFQLEVSLGRSLPISEPSLESRLVIPESHQGRSEIHLYIT